MTTVGLGYGEEDAPRDVVLLTERGATVVAEDNYPQNMEHQSRMILDNLYETSQGQPGQAIDVDELVRSGMIGGPGIVRAGLNRLVALGYAEKARMGQEPG